MQDPGEQRAATLRPVFRCTERAGRGLGVHPKTCMPNAPRGVQSRLTMVVRKMNTHGGFLSTVDEMGLPSPKHHSFEVQLLGARCAAAPAKLEDLTAHSTQTESHCLRIRNGLQAQAHLPATH